MIRMKGWPNYGPFLGTLNIRDRRTGDPKSDHSFDNLPCSRLLWDALFMEAQRVQIYEALVTPINPMPSQKAPKP